MLSSKFLSRKFTPQVSRCLKASSSSSSIFTKTSCSSLGIFSSSRILLDNKTSSSSAELAEFNEQQQQQREDEDDELSTNVQQDEDDDQPFDVVEATLQEVHDLVTAMRTHKHSSAFSTDATTNWKLHRSKAGRVEYQTFRQWELGHALFTEWCDKLEQLLTTDIMKAMVKSAEYFDRHPSQRAFEKAEDLEELTSNPENHSGFAKHPLSYSAASGSEFKSPSKIQSLNRFTDSLAPTPRQSRYGTPNTYSEVQRKKEEIQKMTTKFFLHGPYQIQIARPDASPEVMSQARCYRDRQTLRSLQELVEERHHLFRQLPTQDRLRMIKIVSEALVDESAASENQN